MLAASLFGGRASGASAQEKPPPSRPQDPAPPAVPGESPDPAQAAPEKKLTDEEKRLQKILALRFDRRPSTILKAIADQGRRPPAPSGGESPPSKPVDPVDVELEALSKAVTLGDWARVKAFLAALPEADGTKAYGHFLRALSAAPPAPQPPESADGDAREYQAAMMRAQTGQSAMPPEQNVFMPEDILGLADASPEAPPNKEALEGLGRLLQQALSRGNFIDAFLRRLEAGTGRLGGGDAGRRKAAALLLLTAGRAVEAGPFLPTREQAEAAADAQALNLLSRHHMAVHAKEKTREPLEGAWAAVQSVLTMKDAGEKDKEEALERALDLASQIRKELGADWLEESFTTRPERGIEILTTIGRIVSTNRQQRSSDVRLKKLELQHQAMEALLRVAPGLAAGWRKTLDLLALNWLGEAEYSRQMDTSQNRDPMMQLDRFGNIFFHDHLYNQMQAQSQNQLQPVPTGRLLDLRPSEAWRERIDESLRPKMVAILAQLHLKVNEAEKAFPCIEALAATHRREALDLANEFVDVWARNHDPNREQRRTNPYMFIYGYNPRAAGIPLTRSKQVRNLEDLAVWVKRLRALAVGDLDERRLSKAFTASHSAAEVYRLEDLEKVFGTVDSLKPETLAELLQAMRGNLAGVWRIPKTQEDNKTNRKDKEIEAEIFRGYAVAARVLERGVKAHPDHWALELARAAILFDENAFRYKLTRSAEFTARRGEAFSIFQRAVELYARKAPGLSEAEESSLAYETWFYASLGACDLAHVTHEQPPEGSQPGRIRDALLALPGNAAERHLARFANSLATRMTSVKPEVKHRYLRAGLQVVGEHKQAREARKLFDYYGDLVTEIKLTARVDGSASVGRDAPFGLFVDLRHTKEIERESGGFQKYLQNQLQNPYYFNYGRPQADYRDKFEEAARAALQEHFEVLSVTFHAEKIESRGDPESGWRVTPYAYLLLKARGPEVDEIPSLRFDLDFLDTSGYVVLPVESARFPIDASAGAARPVEKLEVVQTLDERKAGEGKLALEVKATARGVVPALGDILEAGFRDFEVAKTEDQGVSVARMDAEGDHVAAISERTWLLHLAARPGLREQPREFAFGGAKSEGAKMSYQRYVDADLVEVGRVVALGRGYGRARLSWVWWALLPAGVIGLGAAGIYLRRRRAPPKAEGAAYRLPGDLTAFSVIGLLRRIREDVRLKPESAGDLDREIGRIEKHFFNRGEGAPPDLKAIAEGWIVQMSEAAARGNGAPATEAKSPGP